MKILVALNNEFVKENLYKKYGSDVYQYDITIKEEVIEFLSVHNEPYIVITKEGLDGSIDDKFYIKQMKLANENIRIVYIVNKLTSDIKQYLFANEIFNILESDTLTLDNIVDSIEDDTKVIYRMVDTHMGTLNEAAVDYNVQIKNQVLPKQIIAVYGTSGSGKSQVASLLAKNIVKDLNISVALLDMDVQNPSIDIYNNIDIKENGLTKIIDDIDKKLEINEIMDKYMIEDKNNKKLWYMTNNTSIFDIQNKLSNKYYEKIYRSTRLKYDYTVIDLPSSPFLDVVPYTLANSTSIFFVVNPNYISIRQAMKYLDLLNKLWDIPKERISIIINKMQKDSLEKLQIENLLSGYDIVAQLPLLNDMEGYINGSITNIKTYFELSKIYKKLGIENSYPIQKASKPLMSYIFKLKGGNKVDS